MLWALSRWRRHADQPRSGRTADVCQIGRTALHDGHSGRYSLQKEAAKLTDDAIRSAFIIVFERLITAIAGDPCQDSGIESEVPIGLIEVQSCHLSFYGVLWCIKQRMSHGRAIQRTGTL
jgi:hypothetical protein